MQGLGKNMFVFFLCAMTSYREEEEEGARGTNKELKQTLTIRSFVKGHKNGGPLSYTLTYLFLRYIQYL